jgi:nitroreductase
MSRSQADITACVDEVLRGRRSVRAFKPDPLPRETVMEILSAASTAPSNSNTQPWQVHVVGGQVKQALGEALVAAFRDNTAPPSPHFPDPLPSEFGNRQSDFARRYYECLGIERDDAGGRALQTQRNFSFFGAPGGLIFTIDSRLTRYSWLDLGLFVQNVMIAAQARGVATCPQVSFVRFHDVVATHLRLPPGQVTACGMSMGWGDARAEVNRMGMPRERVQDFVRFSGFDPGS